MITALDLTTQVPRSPYDQIGGMPWLARLIDKVRALTAGKIGDYTPFPCGGDKTFLAALGIEADALRAVIDAGKTDAEIVAWVQANKSAGADAALASYVQASALPITDEAMLGYLNGYKAAIAAAKPGVDLSRADNFGRAICIEEGHPLPA